MRAKFFAAVSAAALIAIPTVGVLSTEAGARTLRFADFGPNRGVRAGAIKWMATELEKRSGGELKVQFTWGGALLNAKTSAKGVGAGVADMASVVAVYNPGQMVVYEVTDALMLSDEYAALMASYDLMTKNKTALAEFKKKGMHYFSNYTTGPTQMISRMPIKTVADLKGKKIRATGGFVRAFNKAGATTISLPQPKVYEALSTKTIDGTTSYWYVVKGYKQYEVSGHATELNLGQVAAFGIAMNARTYASLSGKHKKIVDTLSRDFAIHMAHEMVKSRVQTKKELEAGIGGKKLIVQQAAPDLIALLRAEAATDIDKWKEKAKAKNYNADAILKEFEGSYNKYEAEVKSKGYPWDRK